MLLLRYFNKCSMGAGKTYFVKNILYADVKKN